MVSRIHSVLPRLAVFGFLPVLMLGVGAYLWSIRPYSPPEGSDIFETVVGRWAWTTTKDGCASEWHRISFAPDRAVMTITSSKPYEVEDGRLDSIAVYDILEHSQSWIRGAIRGETRLTSDGDPVVWDLVLRSPDRYAWHRTDWVRGALTREIERCADSA